MILKKLRRLPRITIFLLEHLKKNLDLEMQQYAVGTSVLHR